MGTISRFEDLEIWQLARALSKQIYDITARAIFQKDFKLAAQMRDAVCSAMSNPAEGFERNNNREFYYFVRVAKGSTGELRSQLYNCLDRGFMEEDEFQLVKKDLEILSSKQRSFMDYLDRTTKAEAAARKRRG